MKRIRDIGMNKKHAHNRHNRHTSTYKPPFRNRRVNIFSIFCDKSVCLRRDFEDFLSMNRKVRLGSSFLCSKLKMSDWASSKNERKRGQKYTKALDIEREVKNCPSSHRFPLKLNGIVTHYHPKIKLTKIFLNEKSLLPRKRMSSLARKNTK